MLLRKISALAMLAMVLGSSVAAVGQKTGSGGGTAPTKTVEPTQKTSAPVRIVTKYITKPVTPTTGRLFVSAEPGAVILLEPLNVKRTEAQKGTVPEGRRDFVFNDLKPGDYRVAATLEGFHEVEKSPVTIKQNDTESITLYFHPILYSVTLNTNVDAGEVKYGKEGEKPTVETIRQKTIKLSLAAGDYLTEITAPEGLGYKSRHEKISVKEDMAVDLSLERIRFSTEEFLVSWTPAELQGWEVPAGWHVDSKNLIVTSPGVGLPRDVNKRYYQDFQLLSTVKKFNGVGTGFALRAQDSHNYYLLELTGEKSDEPFTARLFVVKNGVERRLQAQPIIGAPRAAIKAGQFSVMIKMRDNRVTVEIEDNNQGMSYPLGALTDPDRTFTAGAVGIATRNNEENIIWEFHVCTECLKGH
jgi:hypothetical protein